MASEITGHSNFGSTMCSGQQQRKINGRHYPFRRETTSDRWIALTELQIFLCSYPEQFAEQTVELLVIWDAMAVTLHHCYGYPPVEWNPSVTDGFPSQRASKAAKVYMYRRHDDI